MIPSKSCSRCLVEKPITNYVKHKECLYGVASICKDCQTLQRQEKTLIKNQGKTCQYPLSKYKKCKTCGIDKENTEQYFRWSSRFKKSKNPEHIHPYSRFQNECKNCEASRQRERSKTIHGKKTIQRYKEKNRTRILEQDKKRRQEKLKDKDYAVKEKEKRKKRYYDNHKKSLDIAKKYREKYPEKVRERSKKYYWQNKDKINKRASAWRKRVRYSVSRRKIDPIYKLKCDCRGRINWLTRRRSTVSNYKKACPQTEKIIGCSAEFYYSHIEKQFIENMTWDNYGEWQVDHIIPLATAKTEEQVLLLNKWDNLQPLWLSDNIKKGTKIPESSLYDYYINEIPE